jgi:uncharacterized repeat protein (TIGR04138 family)
MNSSINVEETLERIVDNDPRYHRDAYYFVRDALDVAQKKFCERKREPQHVSGRQLLQGVRQHALEEFGPMAQTVLEEWGITRCEDFGEIVFNMVEHSLLGKTDEDTRDDFKGGYSFDEAFRAPFLPKRLRRRPTSERENSAASETAQN